jgi:inorganic pyrophosphatase
MKSLADPTRLKPLNKRDGLLQVIIETPAGSRNKFAFDPDQKIFALKKVLPAGMSFPYDFGFLPQTLAPDGDPLDVLLLMDEPAFPGCAVPARLIGVIEGEQVDGKKRIRNEQTRGRRRGQPHVRKCKETGRSSREMDQRITSLLRELPQSRGKGVSTFGM